MKYTIIILALLLTGCSTTVPVKQNFPKAPDALFVKCKELQLVEQNASIIDATKIVVNNYTEYYQCSTQVDGWIEWYQIQQKLFKELR